MIVVVLKRGRGVVDRDVGRGIDFSLAFGVL